MNDDDAYDVLPIQVNLFHEFEAVDKDVAKGFVAVYFPARLLEKMNWNRKTALECIVDGETLIICKKDLQYEMEPESEPTHI